MFKLASCDGCQLTLLGLDLLAVAERLDVAVFAEATSRPDDGQPLDLVLVEGSVSTPDQLRRVREIRARARYLVTIGACATAGGIQALRNLADHAAYQRVVYARPDYVASLATSTPVADHVPVDYALRGCPPDKAQLREVIAAFLAGRRPGLRDESVCMDCKRAARVCVLVARGVACLGPVTQAGCGALCPGYARGCYGCFGPKENPNRRALSAWLEAEGTSPDDVARALRMVVIHE